LGDQFFTEREVAEKFQVSRATANMSLASLVSAGLLEFRKGFGTFVRRDVIDYDVRSLVSFTEKARTAGKKPGTELITFGKLTAAERGQPPSDNRPITGAGSHLDRLFRNPEDFDLPGKILAYWLQMNLAYWPQMNTDEHR
jgi:DNA-binding transcriptional MocR family regulator